MKTPVHPVDILTRSFGLWVFFNILAIIIIGVAQSTFLTSSYSQVTFGFTLGFIVLNILISFILNFIIPCKYFLLEGREMLKSVGILAALYCTFVIVVMLFNIML